MRQSLASAGKDARRRIVLQRACAPGIIHEDDMLEGLCEAFDAAHAAYRQVVLARDVRNIMDGAERAGEGLDIRI